MAHSPKYRRRRHTLGSLKTLGVRKAASVAAPLICCTRTAERRPWAPARLRSMEGIVARCVIVDEGTDVVGIGYHKRQTKLEAE